MMKRRAFLSVATGSLLVAGSEMASAQAFKPPQSEDLLRLLRTPALIEKILLATSALRTLLLFERSRIEKDEKGDIWHRDEEKFFALLGQLRDPVAQATVMKQLESKDARSYSNSVTVKAIPVVKRMEDSLGKGGLPPGSPLSIDLLTSFLQVDHFLTVLSHENDSWYCRIYPLSVFCG